MGGTVTRLGGHGPRMPPLGAGPANIKTLLCWATLLVNALIVHSAYSISLEHTNYTNCVGEPKLNHSLYRQLTPGHH